MRESGFTLVETVVAAVVLAVGILAVVGTQRAAEQLSSAAARRAAAVEEAATLLDRERVFCADSGVGARRTVAAVPVPGEPSARAVRVEAIVACGAP